MDDQHKADESPDNPQPQPDKPEETERAPVSPEVRSTPDLQTRSTPPPPDPRPATPTDNPQMPDSEPEPEPGLEPEGPESTPDPEVVTEQATNSPPAAPAPAPVASKTPKSRPVRTANPKWGWVLVLGPLAVALAIIAWFHFRVLPPVDNNSPPVVDFPVDGVASQPDPPSSTPTAPVQTPPTQPPAPNPETPPTSRPPNDPDTNDPPADDDPIEDPDGDPDPDDTTPVEPEPVEFDPSQFGQFSRHEFINLFDDIGGLPNLGQSSLPAITDEVEVDQKLQKIAARAGYVPQPAVVDAGQLVGVHQLQPLLAEHWSQLKQAAVAAGHSLTITTGYLSSADQTVIFLSQLSDDLGDEALAAAATQVAIPGYSRHQTGFAIDIVDSNNPQTPFSQTPAYDWLAADNFTAAKHFGFVPSYAGGSGHGQAAHQTAFELVFVGRDRLLAR